MTPPVAWRWVAHSNWMQSAFDKNNALQAMWLVTEGGANRELRLEYKGRCTSLVSSHAPVKFDGWWSFHAVISDLEKRPPVVTAAAMISVNGETKALPVQLASSAFTPDHADLAGINWAGSRENLLFPVTLVSREPKFDGILGTAIDLWFAHNMQWNETTESMYAHLGNIVVPRGQLEEGGFQ